MEIKTMVLLACIVCIAAMIMMLCVWIGSMLPSATYADIPRYVQDANEEDCEEEDPTPPAKPPAASPPAAALVCASSNSSNNDSDEGILMLADLLDEQADLRAILTQLQQKDIVLEQRLKYAEKTDGDIQRMLVQLQTNRQEREALMQRIRELESQQPYRTHSPGGSRPFISYTGDTRYTNNNNNDYNTSNSGNLTEYTYNAVPGGVPSPAGAGVPAGTNTTTNHNVFSFPNFLSVFDKVPGISPPTTATAAGPSGGGPQQPQQPQLVPVPADTTRPPASKRLPARNPQLSPAPVNATRGASRCSRGRGGRGGSNSSSSSSSASSSLSSLSSASSSLSSLSSLSSRSSGSSSATSFSFPHRRKRHVH